VFRGAATSALSHGHWFPWIEDHEVCRCIADTRFVGLCSASAMHDSTALERSGKNMAQYVEQYQVWGGGLTRPSWPDVQGWKGETFSMTEVPGTPVPAWFQKILRSKKPLADIEKFPLVGG
jgi:hypothetical protein